MYRGVSAFRLLGVYILAIAMILIVIPTASAQLFEYSLQIGAVGDSASIGNIGVQVEIKTHVSDVYAPDLGDAFWVGNNLINGTFIQFGYELSPSYSPTCLSGEVSGGQGKCQGSPENIGNGDARWFWEYWPNLNTIHFYYGIGEAHSAGNEGSWHLYTIEPNAANGWNFVLDGQTVASFNNFQYTASKDPAFIIAEEVNMSPESTGKLGPVEFRNLQYLKQTDREWHQVTSLIALSGCGVISPNCGTTPYGISIEGPNDILAGTGLQTRQEGELLWPRLNTLTLNVPYSTQIMVDGSYYGTGPIQISLLSGEHTLTLPEHIQIDGTSRLRFDGWSDGYASPNRTVNLSSDASLEAIYVTQYKLTIQSTAQPVAVEGWYDQGTIASFPTESSWQLTNTSLQVFNGWYENGVLVSNSPSSSVLMNRPYTVEPVWYSYSIFPPLFIILGALGVLYVGKGSLYSSGSEDEGPTKAVGLSMNHVMMEYARTSESQYSVLTHTPRSDQLNTQSDYIAPKN